MKINRLETHDRLLNLKKQGEAIGAAVQDIINQRPFGNHAFYLFAHKRELGIDERQVRYDKDFGDSLTDYTYVRKYTTLEDVPTHRLIWQPRLTKPTAQMNSMLYKAYPGTDKLKVIWNIPDISLWDQYKKGNVTEHKEVSESIYAFVNNREALEAKEPDDYSDEMIRQIYLEMANPVKWNIT